MHYSEVPDHNPPSKAILEYDLDFIVLQCRFQLPAVNGFNPFTKVPCLRHCKKIKIQIRHLYLTSLVATKLISVLTVY